MINLLGISNFLMWLGVIGALTFWLCKNIAPLVGLSFGWVAYSSLKIFANSLNGIPNDQLLRLYDLVAESALLSLLLTMCVALCFWFFSYEKFFKVVGLINALLIFAGFAIHPHDVPWGLLLNGSMSGCFNASLYPLYKNKWCRGVIILSVVLAGRSIPLAVLASVIATQFLFRRRYLPIFLTALVAASIGFFIKGKMFFYSNGRSWVWERSYDYFKQHVSYWQGSGLGQFYVLGNSFTEGRYIWLHSDWLQILFETGIVGFVLVAGMYGQALYYARRTPNLFAALVGFGVFAIANMPLRYPLVGLYGAVIVLTAFVLKGAKHGKEKSSTI